MGILSVAAVSAVMLVAAPASADTSTFSKTFAVDDTSYTGTSVWGVFTAQVKYVSNGSSQNPVTFSLTTSAATRALAAGNMSCTANQFDKNGKVISHDFHGDVPITYIWHWTAPSNPIGADFQERADCYFPAKTGGQAHLGAILFYIVGDGGGD